MFIYTIAAAVFLLLPFSLAAPLVARLAPIRPVQAGGRNPDGGYIVAIKPNTVDPNNRGRWLTRILSAQNVTLDDDTTKSLKLKWNQAVFNGLAGKFSSQALTALQKQPEVAWIQEGLSLLSTLAWLEQ